MVLDRGMAFDDNIAEIKTRKLHYVVASRQPERDRWLADFEDTDGFIAGTAPAFPAQPGSEKDQDRGQDPPSTANTTYVLCRSEQRIAKDRAIRSKQEQRLLADIDKLSRRIADKSWSSPTRSTKPSDA